MFTFHSLTNKAMPLFKTTMRYAGTIAKAILPPPESKTITARAWVLFLPFTHDSIILNGVLVQPFS